MVGEGGCAGGVAQAGGEGVVDEDVDGFAGFSGGEAAEERAADGECEEREEQHAAGEKEPFFEHDAAALAAIGLKKEAHGAPHDGLAPAVHEEMDDDRDGDAGEAGGEERGVEEGHGRPPGSDEVTVRGSDEVTECRSDGVKTRHGCRGGAAPPPLGSATRARSGVADAKPSTTAPRVVSIHFVTSSLRHFCSTHPNLLRLICEFRFARNAAIGGPSQSWVFTSW